MFGGVQRQGRKRENHFPAQISKKYEAQAYMDSALQNRHAHIQMEPQ